MHFRNTINKNAFFIIRYIYHPLNNLTIVFLANINHRVIIEYSVNEWINGAMVNYVKRTF